MRVPDQPECWDGLYRSQGRQWRGVSRLPDLPIPEEGRVLDLGCGNGKTSAALMERGYRVTVADFSKEAVSACACQMKGPVDAVVCDCEDLPFRDGSFDAVVMVHLLDHLGDPGVRRTAAEVFRVLRPGGVVFVRSFSSADMRVGDAGGEIRGNGVFYRYYDEGDIPALFEGFEVISDEVVKEETRFGTVRARVECLLRRNGNTF